MHLRLLGSNYTQIGPTGLKEQRLVKYSDLQLTGEKEWKSPCIQGFYLRRDTPSQTRSDLVTSNGKAPQNKVALLRLREVEATFSTSSSRPPPAARLLCSRTGWDSARLGPSLSVRPEGLCTQPFPTSLS